MIIYTFLWFDLSIYQDKIELFVHYLTNFSHLQAYYTNAVHIKSRALNMLYYKRYVPKQEPLLFIITIINAQLQYKSTHL